MTRRLAFLPLLAVLACGGSEEPSRDEELANASRLTSERAEEQGDYCCYRNGTLEADAPAGCRAARGCFFSETYSDVNAAGRGRMCGYLICDDGG